MLARIATCVALCCSMSHAQISSNILELADFDGEVGIHQVLKVVLDQVPGEEAGKVFEDWSRISRNLDESRAMAGFLEEHLPGNPWAQKLLEGKAGGVYFLRPEQQPEGSVLAISYGLVEMFRLFKDLEIIEAELQVQVVSRNGESVLPKVRFSFPETAYPQVLTIELPELNEGVVLRATTRFTSWCEDFEEFNLEIQHSFKAQLEEGSIVMVQVREDLSEIDPRATEADEAYRALRSTIAQRKQAANALAVVAPVHAGVDSPLLNVPAPELTLVDWKMDEGHVLKGGTVEFRGRVTLLDFWATWCGPCIASFPKLNKLHNEHAASGFQVVSVCSTRGNDAAGAERFVRQYDHVFAKGTPEAFDAYGVTAYPTLVLVDSEGVVRWVGLGANSLPSRELVQSLLKKRGGD